MNSDLTDRQQREIDFHRAYAEENRGRLERPVDDHVLTSKKRRWWNAYWSTYDILLACDLRQKRVLVPGCGFGEDAVRLSFLGAEVHAFDLSSEIIEIAKERCEKFGYDGIAFKTMPSENMEYPDDFFDFILCLDILHHVDIGATMAEFRRTLKQGGHLVGDELYTHSALEKNVRKNKFVENFLYPRMAKYIYRTDKPYITEDEHKIDEKEFSLISDFFKFRKINYFNVLEGRLFPAGSLLSRLDRCLAKALGGWGRYFAGRIVFDGVVRK